MWLLQCGSEFELFKRRFNFLTRRRSKFAVLSGEVVDEGGEVVGGLVIYRQYFEPQFAAQIFYLVCAVRLLIP